MTSPERRTSSILDHGLAIESTEEDAPRTPRRRPIPSGISSPSTPTSFLSPSSSFCSTNFSMFGGGGGGGGGGYSPSSVVRQWSGTPPSTPTQSKLRSEYHARITSPVKRRMSLEQQLADVSSPKRSNSPLSLRRSHSDGLVYGDRFIPARNAPQMEIAYSLMDEGDVAVANASSPFRGRVGRMSSLPSSGSFSASPSVSVAASPSGLFPSSSSASLLPDLASTSAGTSTVLPPALPADTVPTDVDASTQSPPTGAGETGRESQSILNMLLKSELLGVEYPSYMRNLSDRKHDGSSSVSASSAASSSSSPAASGRDASTSTIPAASGSSTTMASPGRFSATGDATSSTTTGLRGGGSGGGGIFSTSTPNLLQFKSPREKYGEREDMTRSFSLLPVCAAQRRLLSTPTKAKRKISKMPFKVLDAPALQDDFYLNLVDWSSLNVLAVALGSCVYLWSACTSKVTKLCDLGSEDAVTSVAWTQRGTHLAVGTNTGEVQMWDASRCKKARTMTGHSARIGTMSWNGQVLASGSRDRLIYLRDVRVREPFVSKLQGHRQEVCGLRWSFDDNQLASGGNDNKLFIWNLHSSQPVAKFTDHTAAVKAIAWSPHQSGLLASGGGTADRCIRFWNTLTGTSLSRVDTGSQVCNLIWSKNINEIVSTHGYSLNQIIVWRYPSMTKVATLTGHTFRVLYLALSPDGQTVVTGAGDETLRFWNVFPSAKRTDGSRLGTSLLFPVGHDIR